MPVQLGELKLYSLQELTKALGLTTHTLRAYIRQGKLRARKAGTRWFVSEDSLREYFNGKQEPKTKKLTSLQGITTGSKVTDKDLREAKKIWK
ncbi:MAG: hypothetical protein MAG551_00733 [Candidatus Scalindua arabica]|uniref:Helix-turn-helix domain-containing protein n=1 Tax=Candidatus Scalindua arabica TaxID=1127984 RepID=A0A941W1I5_9BACT|nr:hypothetical protein [Candidatus Scalindua arabica]